MFASIRRYNVNPDLINSLIRRVEEGFIPIINNTTGDLSPITPLMQGMG
jgi:hypothetical protein